MTEFLPAYRHWRALDYSPHAAKARALLDVEIGRTRYRGTFYTVHGPVSRQYDNYNYAWIETPDSIFRLVGFADEVSNRISHRGWYTDESQDEVYRGVIYRLAGKDKAPRFVAGYADPNNDAAFIDLTVVTDEKDAARFADDLAKYHAAKERDYQAASNARFQFDQLESDIATYRKSILELLRERRALKPIAVNAPASCKAIRARVLSLLQSISEARKEREELADSYNHTAAWKDA